MVLTPIQKLLNVKKSLHLNKRENKRCNGAAVDNCVSRSGLQIYLYRMPHPYKFNIDNSKHYTKEHKNIDSRKNNIVVL